MLTDDVLRARLEWDHFHIVKSFSIADLGLDVHRPTQRPVYQPVFLNSSLVHAAENSVEIAQPSGISHSKQNVQFFIDPVTKEKVHVSDVNRKGMGSTVTYTAARTEEGKRQRDEALADEDEQGRQLLRRYSREA